MTLRAKALLVSGAATLGLVLVVSVGARVLLLRSFAELEATYAARDVERVLSALNEDLENIDASATDYATYDESYEFVASPSSDYIESEFPGQTLVRLRLSLVMIVDRDRNIVMARACDLERGAEMAVPAETAERIRLDPRLAGDAARADRPLLKGIVSLPSGPALLTARPILRADGSGPARGALVMARAIDAVQTRRLAETTHLALAFLAPGHDRLPSELGSGAEAERENAGVVTRPLGSDRIAGYAFVRDPMGQPVQAVEVVSPREVYQRGQRTIAHLLVAVIAVGFIVSAGVLLGMGRVTRSLHSVTAGVRDMVVKLAEVSSEVERSARSLSRGAGRQAESIEATSHAIAGVATGTRRSAEHAGAAARTTLASEQLVAASLTALNRAVATVSGVAGSSRQINSIVKTIEEIALQTKLLALNAAVEAARAGSAGAGFSVVAGEVHVLAQRSAQAAQDTAALVEQAAVTAMSGADETRRLSEVISAIAAQVTEVRGLMDAVDADSRQQSSEIDEVVRSVTRIADETRATEAAAQANDAATEALRAQVDASKRLVLQLEALTGRGSETAR